jgi:hypothetical protein
VDLSCEDRDERFAEGGKMMPLKSCWFGHKWTWQDWRGACCRYRSYVPVGELQVRECWKCGALEARKRPDPRADPEVPFCCNGMPTTPKPTIVPPQ